MLYPPGAGHLDHTVNANNSDIETSCTGNKDSVMPHNHDGMGSLGFNGWASDGPMDYMTPQSQPSPQPSPQPALQPRQNTRPDEVSLLFDIPS